MSGFLGGQKPTNSPPVYSGLQVSTSQYNVPVALFWGQRRLGTNALDYIDFQKRKVKAKGKGGGGKGAGNYEYSAATIRGLCEGPVDAIYNAWADGSTTTTTTLSDLNMTLFTGTASQLPWSFMSTKYPSRARAYAYTAYLACPKEELGSAAALPDISFECARSAGFSYTHSTTGWTNPTTSIATAAIDCLLSDIIEDLLLNPQYGGYFSEGDLGSMTLFASYQRAQGLFFSPLLSSQSKVTDLLDRWATLANSWIYWSGTQLEFVPLGDSAITGNGASYTPQQDVAYALAPGDFIASEGAPPVRVTRKDPADCHNRTTLSFCDRSKGYVTNNVEYKDQTLIDTPGIGQRDATSVQADDVCDPAVAEIIVQLLGKRSAYIRKTYEFTLPYRYVRCLPGTILTLTEPTAGLDAERVRVTKVRRNQQRELEISAEEFPGTAGTYTTALATVAPELPRFPNFYTLPGSVNTPAIAEPDSRFTGGEARIIIAASGGPFWGGCDVYLSFDGTSYGFIGRIEAAAAQGVLTDDLPAYGGVNPDTINTLSIECDQSEAEIIAVSAADADELRALALISVQPDFIDDGYELANDGEILAFGDVSATGTYSADLTYLQRGQYGTAAAAHSTGDQFTALDVLGVEGSSISYTLPPRYIGQTLYLKFASYNIFNLSAQDLSTVPEYRYVPAGRGYGTASGGRPSAVSGLAGSDNGSAFVLSWAAAPAADNVRYYSLYRADGAGADFDDATMIWTGQSLRYADLAIADGASFTYFATASNAVGESVASAGVSVTTVIPAAPTIDILSIVWAQDSASETAGARVMATVSGPSGTGLTWWVRWKAEGDATWNEQRFTGLGAAPVTVTTGFVTANATIEVEAAWQSSGGRQSDWSGAETISTHPTADITTITADTTSLRASMR